MATRKSFSGNAVATRLTGDLGAGVTSFSVTDATGYPDGSAGPFVVTIDRGLDTEETILVTSRSGTLFTVATRGYDGTTDQNHPANAVVEHTLDTVTIDEANELAAKMTTAGDLLYHGGSGPARLGVGQEGELLTVGSSGTPEWADIFPPLMVFTIFASTAPTGWLELDGSVVADATYPILTDAIKNLGSPWNDGSEGPGNTRLPDLRAAVIGGRDADETYITGMTEIGARGGQTAFTLSAAQLPPHAHTMAHTHAIDHDHGSVVSGGQSATHSHAMSHGHGTATAAASGSHSHLSNIGGSLLIESLSPGPFQWVSPGNDGYATGGGTNAAGDHTHSVPIPFFSGSTAGAGNDHTHTVDLPNHTGSSGGSSAAETGNGPGSNAQISPYQPTVIGMYVVRAR